MISFCFYSSCFKVYIHLPCINTQRQTTAPFLFVITIVTGEFTILELWKYVFRFFVILFSFFYLILKFISIYPESTHSDKQHHFLRDCHCHGWVHYILNYENTVLRFLWYRLVFIRLVLKFISVYPA